MSESVSTNKVLMRRIYEEMWNRAHPALAGEIFSQPAGVEAYVRQFLQSFSDLEHTVREMLEEGDQVAVRFSAQGTHTGDWMDFAATGKSIRYTGVTWARIVQGKIVEHYTWWDRASLIEQVKG